MIDWLQSIGIDLQPRRYAHKGYSHAVAAWSDTIVVSWHEAHERMGVHLQISSKGLTLIESLGVSIPQFTQELIHQFKAKFSRLDVALTTDLIHAREVMSLARANQWRGAARSLRFQESYPDAGCTTYFGSRQSEVMLRVYDKTAEQKLTDGVTRTRFEWEVKGSMANAIAKYVATFDLKKLYGFCRDYVQFIDRDGRKNVSRFAESDWWVKLMKYDRWKPAVENAVTEVVTKTYKWLKTQVAPTLAALMAAGMLDETMNLIEHENYRFKDKHRALIEILKSLGEKPELLGLNHLWNQQQVFPFEKKKFKKNRHLVLTSAFQLR